MPHDQDRIRLAFTDASTQYSRREPALVQVPSSLETLLVYVDSNGVLRQSSLQAGNGQFWEPSSLSFTTTRGLIASTRSVSMVAVGQEVWMASPSSASIRLYRLSGPNSPPATARTWQLMATLNYTTEHRPNLAAVADLVDPSLTRLVLLYTSSGDYKYAQSGGGTSAAAWVTGWTSASFERLPDPNLRQPSGGAVVWDDRPIVTTAAPAGHPNWPDLRSTLEFGAVCTMTSQCTGLSPAATCNTTTGFCELNGDPYVRTDFAPFTRGPAIGNYADYDDWEMLPFKTCELFLGEPSLIPAEPPGTMPPARYCGAIPRLTEPWGTPVTTYPPLNDRVVNAHLCAPAPACTFPQPCAGP